MYILPAYILAFLNGLLLNATELKIKSKILQIGIGLFVLGLLTYCAIGKESPIQFVGAFGIIGIGVTNIIWITKLIGKKALR